MSDMVGPPFPDESVAAKASPDPEVRHEFGCTAYVGRPCICVQLRKQRGGA